jgi:sulfate permease, SulP family
MKLLEDLEHLGLNPGSFIVVGSGILEVLGIRDAIDIDVIVDPGGLRKLAVAGWEQDDAPRGKQVLLHGRFEASISWTSPEGELTIRELAPHSVDVNGYLFIGLPFLLHWKKALRRPKDLTDIDLIETYLKTSGEVNES